MKNRFYLLGLAFSLMPFISLAQNVGIGTNAPTGPLSFANQVGNKLVLWGDGSTGHYGIGVQSTFLQLYADLPNSNIVFGHGRSSAFTERVRITNSGADGMTINGRVHLRNGTQPINPDFTPGVWLYKPDNSGLLGFMGAQNSQNIGFFGGPGGWGFTYDAINSRVGIGNPNPAAPLSFANAAGRKIIFFQGGAGNVGIGVHFFEYRFHTDVEPADITFGYENLAGQFTERFRLKGNGALGLSGNTGQPGQVLVSNGANAAASWSAAPGYVFVAAQTQNSETVSPGNVRDIPGLVANFTITSPSRVVFQYRARIDNTSCFGCGEKRGFVSLYQNITGGTQTVVAVPVYMPNGEFNDAVSGPIPVDLQPGTYSYKLVLEASILGNQPMIALGSGFGRLTWQIFPL